MVKGLVMRFIRYYLGYCLSKVRYRSKADPFKIFKSFSQNERAQEILNDRRVLLLPIRVSPMSNLFEGVYGSAMKIRGAKVYSLLEANELSYSENNLITKNRFLTNVLSYFEQIRFYKIFNFTPLFYQSFINLKKLKTFESEIRQMEFGDLLEIEQDGILIGKNAKYALMRYLMVETLKPEYKNLLIEFLLTSFKTKLVVEAVIDEISPTEALMSHGCYATWGTALEVLKKNDIETIIWGRGYVADGELVVSKNNSTLYERIYEHWEPKALTKEQKDSVISYFSGKRAPQNSVDWVTYYDDPSSGATSNIEDKCKGFSHNVGVYPNIPWDGTMYSSSKNFPSVRSFVQALKLCVINNPDMHFIFRAHPAEKARKDDVSRETFSDIFYEEFIGEYNNITFINPESPISSYQISEITDVALMFGSTLSLEFAIARHPVIQVGKTNTSNKGIVFEPENNEELQMYLNELRENKLFLSESQYENALSYAYYWIFERHIEDPFIKLNKLQFESYKFSSLSELKYGCNTEIDAFMESMKRL